MRNFFSRNIDIIIISEYTQIYTPHYLALALLDISHFRFVINDPEF